MVTHVEIIVFLLDHRDENTLRLISKPTEIFLKRSVSFSDKFILTRIFFPHIFHRLYYDFFENIQINISEFVNV